MAVNTTLPIASTDYMALPLSISRGNPNPLDTSDLYSSLADAQAYASSDPTAYVGQIISTVVKDGSTFTVTMYQIADEAGTLKEVGTGASEIFSDARFTAIKDAVEKLEGDENTDGSLLQLKAMMTVTCTQSTVSGVKHWKFYQNYNLVDDPSDPTKKIKQPIEIADVAIDADIFVDHSSVVTVTKVVDPGTGDVSYIDSESEVPPSGVTEGKYIKMVMSNGDKLYISVADITSGLASSVKLATGTIVADNQGIVDLSNLSTDDIKPGTTDTWILNGGSSAQ